MKRKISCILTVAAIIIMCCPTGSFAKTSGWVSKNFGIFSISCCNTCNKSNGTGKTKGAPYGYKNVANIIIKNSSGTSLGGNSVTTAYDFIASAYKSSGSNNVYSTLSGHYVKDSDGNPADSLYLQVQLTETR